MYEHIIFAYENLPEDSLVLKLMVEMQCLRWELDFDGDEEKQRRLDLPKAFLVQVMVRLVELRDRNIALQDRDIGIEEFNAGDFYMQEESEEAGEWCSLLRSEDVQNHQKLPEADWVTLFAT